MLRLFLIFSILILCRFASAQKEGNIWYFGQWVGLDFNSGTAVPLNNGQLISDEGCSSISDSNGNLLFYTNGVVVYNKNHVIMPNGNGLLGHPSSTQAALIVKKPASSTIYYIFTVDAEGRPNGLRYSEVDITLDGGLGDVTNNKNIPLLSPTSEKVTAIRHQNNTDFWIITHLDNSNAFYCYLLTSAGLNMTPVINNIGDSVAGSFGTPFYNYSHTQGQLKGSLDGNRIVIANKGLGHVQLFDFDKSTGILSNTLTIDNFIEDQPYGVEFSPDGKILYVVDTDFTSSDGYLYQFNLLAGSATAIMNSRITIYPTGYRGGQLQLGPDKKIYMAFWGSALVRVINKPNVIGLSCDFSILYLHSGGSNNQSKIGLPNFYNTFTNYTVFSTTNRCIGDTTNFTYTSTAAVDSVFWNFNDPISTINNTSTSNNPTHYYANSGWYNVSLTFYFEGISETITDSIYINPLPTIELGNDTTLCQGEVLVLDAAVALSDSLTTVLWQNNSTNPTLIVNNAGTYWATKTENNCVASDTIIVGVNPLPVVSLGNDTILCVGGSYTIDATTPNATYLWQDSTTNPTLTVNVPGTYWVEVTVNNCKSTDAITITNFTTLPPINIGNDTTICLEESFTLQPNASNVNYLWQDNSTDETFLVTQAGTYWVTATNQCDMVSDTIQVFEEDCNIILGIPNTITPNGDGINDYWIIENLEKFPNNEVEIFNRNGSSVFQSANYSNNWNGTYQGNDLPATTYYYIINLNNGSGIIKGDLSIIREK